MKIIPNCYNRHYNVDIVIDTLQHSNFKYASKEEKTDRLYSEQFQAYFDHNTHDLIEKISGIGLMYAGECNDFFTLERMRRDGNGKFVDEMIQKSKSALYEELGISVEEEKEL